MRDEREFGPAERARQALEFVRKRLGDPRATLEIISGDASFRRYFRVTTAHPGSVRPLLLMDAPPEREPVEPFVRIQRILDAAAIRVPELAVVDDVNGFILLEDLGDELLYRRLAIILGARDGIVDAVSNDCAAQSCQDLRALYRIAIDRLVDMQAGVSSPSIPAYDASLLGRELALFPEWYLERHLGRGPNTYDRAAIEVVFDALITEATDQPSSFVHRDYHSRNLLVIDQSRVGSQDLATGSVKAPFGLGMIDFQDAVRGPVTYDLASLLRDVYVELPDDRVAELIGYYRMRAEQYLPASAGVGVPDEQFQRWFDWISIQRHLKILGIFARLNYRDGKADYMTSIPLTIRYLRREAGRYAQMQPLVELLDSLPGG